MVDPERPLDGGESLPMAAAQDPSVDSVLRAQRLASLGQMAAHVAHDFRALLVPIAGFAHALRLQLPADPLLQQRAAEIMRAAELGGEFAQQILKLAYGRARAKQPLSLGAAVREALPLLRAAVDAHVDIRVAVDPRSPAVLADSVDIQRVLLNLVLNASQAVRPPLGVIEIGVVGMPGDVVRLTVADNGVGMSQAAVVSILESLSRPIGSRPGVGLGLWIVNQLVQDHGGQLRIESEPGVGTTVRIDLPATHEAQ